jgi:Kef-type K+ transport system membrane component KefB
MSDYALTRILASIIVLLLAAHILGSVFARLRQPRAIGEIVGGMLVGPTVLGLLAPAAQRWLFDPAGGGSTALSVLRQFGLLLLMMCAGTEIRRLLGGGRNRVVAAVAGVGILLPFAAGIGVLTLVSLRSFYGPAGTGLSFSLVFATAIAVTSIPVISRILYDLGVISTPFARLVLGVAVVEDIVLYVVLAIALGAAAGPPSTFGLSHLLGLRPSSAPDIAYHTAATLLLLGSLLTVAALRRRRVRRGRPYRSVGPVGRVVALLAVTVIALAGGVEPFLGALAVGMIVGAGASPQQETATGSAHDVVARFSFAFFIPLYFASVGVTLDLVHAFNPLFFVAFLLFACVVKAGSVYLGARLAKARPGLSRNLAIALNARGGPGIVLASVAYQAKVINQSFYACLVMLAIITSLLAGSWLDRQPRDIFTTGVDPGADVGGTDRSDDLAAHAEQPTA